MAKKTKTPALVSRHAHHTVTVQAGVSSKAIIPPSAENVNGKSTSRIEKSPPTIFEAVTFADYLEAFQRDFESPPISTDARNLLDSMWKKDRRAAESALWAWAEWGEFCGSDGKKKLADLKLTDRKKAEAVRCAVTRIKNDKKIMRSPLLHRDLIRVIEQHKRKAGPDLGKEKGGRPADPRNRLLHELRLGCKVYLGRVDPKLSRTDAEGWSTLLFKAFLGDDVNIPSERSLTNALARVRRTRKTLGIPLD